MGYSGGTTGLSPEARRALQLVADGLGTAAIAAQLGCDQDAVRRCLADAIRVLDARLVPDAVQVALQRGLIELHVRARRSSPPERRAAAPYSPDMSRAERP